MKIQTIDTGFFKLDGGAMFGVVPKSMWSKTNPADANNMCTWAMRCLLIETEDRKILVDTGIGNKQSEKFFSRYDLHGEATLLSSLAKKNVESQHITDVFLTHLHFDHVGGAVCKENETLRTTFPKAKYWSNQSHWKWATMPNAREKASFLEENILPIEHAQQLFFVEETQNIHFDTQIKIRFAYGHTHAMMLPQIEYRDKIFVFMADLLPSVGHIPLPYVMGYDMFPMKTLDEKEKFLSEAAEKQMYLILQHDPQNEVCTVEKTEKGVRLKEVFKLADLM